MRVQKYAINDFTALSASEARKRMGKLRFREAQKTIAGELLPEIQQRLRFMENVGLGYLALGRSAKTLSGGESRRIRLAAQLGSNLRGVLYVLDEPTIGLHPRDNFRLLDTLAALRKKETRSLLSSTMTRQCDAPTTLSILARAQAHGGKSSSGNPARYRACENSETGRCLKTPLSSHPKIAASIARRRKLDRVRGLARTI